MKTYKDEAIIIRVKPLKEADKLLILLTKNYGVIETVAKGGAKSTSRKVSSIDLLNNIKVELYKSDGIDIIREIEVKNDYIKLKQNKDTINQLLYIVEIVNRLFNNYIGESDIFFLLKSLLEHACDAPEYIEKYIAGFELKLLKLSGFEPKLQEYTNTGQKMEAGDKRILAYGEELGYAYSEESSSEESIKDEIIKVQRFLITSNFDQIKNLTVERKFLLKIIDIHKEWIERTIEKRLKSRSILKY